MNAPMNIYNMQWTDSQIAEDNMNCQLKDITVTARDGRVSHLDQVYIRGSHVRYFIVPDMLRYGLHIFVEDLNADRQQECAHVQISGRARQRCWFGKRSGHSEQGQRQPWWTPWISRRSYQGQLMKVKSEKVLSRNRSTRPEMWLGRDGQLG